MTKVADEDVDREAHNEHDPSKGPFADRSCRDVIFIICFGSFWFGMYVLAGFAFSYGDPFRLLLLRDYQYNKCDMAKGYDGFKYLYFPSLLQPEIFICVKECPRAIGNFTDPLDQYNPYYTYNMDGQCSGKHVCDVGTQYTPSRDQLLDIPTLEEIEQAQNSSLTPNTNYHAVRCWCPYNTKKLLTVCYPEDMEKLLDSNNETIKKFFNKILELVEKVVGDTAVIERIFADFVRVWWIFPVAGAVAVFMGFGWLFVLRLFAGVLVWVTIIAVGIGLALLTRFLYSEAEQANSDASSGDTINENKKDNAKLLEYAAIAITVLDIALIVILIFMRKRIQIAIGIIKEASKALASMPTIIFFPVVPFAMLLVLLIYWIYVALYLVTIKIDETGKTVEEVEAEQQQVQGMQLYHFFGLLWTVNTIIAITQCSIAGAIASWYWTLDKSKASPMPIIPAFIRVFRYHLGSMIFGALIIAIVQFIRAIIAYIQRQMKGKDNLIIKIAFCLLDCVFACFERFIKFINKNAYILIAVYGYSFCQAARKAFFILLANAMRVAAVTMVGDFLIFMGKLAITAATSYVCLMIMRDEADLQFWVTPLIVSCHRNCFGVKPAAFESPGTSFLIYGSIFGTMYLTSCVSALTQKIIM
eukprot:TRINITY_DN283_c0_g1_i11.p1 TRINITY_DN283_c0_g1~~TRINITY_DN283_c0_g1_i11.p1  ORF type:complete len:642 (-),score=116.12 TRINITY_DN283_c0_g1_i11:700-2625(-)